VIFKEDIGGLQMVTTARWLDRDQIAEIRGLIDSEDFIRERQ